MTSLSDVTFYEDFNSGMPSGWYQINGTWSVPGYELLGESVSGASIVYDDEMFEFEGTFEFDMRDVQAPTYDAAGFILTESYGYEDYIAFGWTADSEFRVVEAKNNVREMLYSDYSDAIRTGTQSNHIKVVIDGSYCYVYINAEDPIVLTIQEHGDVYIGFAVDCSYNSSNAAKFDNVRVIANSLVMPAGKAREVAAPSGPIFQE
jgi:hypothetical protein